MEVFLCILIPFIGTTLGASCVFFMKREMSEKIRRILTGFAAGVMVAASIWSLIVPAIEQSEGMGRLSFIPAVIGFWVGILFLLLLDKVIPHLHAMSGTTEGVKSSLAKTTMMVLAVTLHNIPEGIAVSIPIFYATGDRKKAFKLSLLSGLAEPVGALLAYLVLMPFMSPTLMGCILAGVAGIMVFISIDELLPAAREYGEAHISIYGVVAGMALMAVSLILLA